MSTEQEYEKFNLDSMYEHYLRVMGLTNDMMPPSQQVERKRAWMCGFAQAMAVFMSDMPDDEEGIHQAIATMNQQLTTFLEESIKVAEEIQRGNLP